MQIRKDMSSLKVLQYSLLSTKNIHYLSKKNRRFHCIILHQYCYVFTCFYMMLLFLFSCIFQLSVGHISPSPSDDFTSFTEIGYFDNSSNTEVFYGYFDFVVKYPISARYLSIQRTAPPPQFSEDHRLEIVDILVYAMP